MNTTVGGTDLASPLRKSGWTWTKEILGTIIGVCTVITPIFFLFLSWMRSVETSLADQRVVVAVQTLELSHLKEQRTEIQIQLRELTVKVDLLLQRIPTK